MAADGVLVDALNRADLLDIRFSGSIQSRSTRPGMPSCRSSWVLEARNATGVMPRMLLVNHAPLLEELLAGLLLVRGTAHLRNSSRSAVTC